MKINIGGGPKWQHEGWTNLDDVGAEPFALTPECTLPMANASVDLVYSSHTLEHLDDATVARVLDEARRVLKSAGELVVKIPNFDDILARYRDGDLDYFHHWPNIRTMTQTAHSRGMKVTLSSLAAQCFCGFFNKEFGHMFRGYDLKRAGAYYGPPVMTESELQTAMALPTPHAIAAALRAHVIANETDYTFNHQNAWSRQEFEELALDHGHAVIDNDASRIIAACLKRIPGIADQREISAYYVAILA